MLDSKLVPHCQSAGWLWPRLSLNPGWQNSRVHAAYTVVSKGATWRQLPTSVAGAATIALRAIGLPWNQRTTPVARLSALSEVSGHTPQRGTCLESWSQQAPGECKGLDGLPAQQCQSKVGRDQAQLRPQLCRARYFSSSRYTHPRPMSSARMAP